MQKVLAIGLIIFSVSALIFSLPYISKYDSYEPIVGETSMALPFEVDTSKKYLLLYFGYVGCQTICSPVLSEVSSAMKALESGDELQFYFINIGNKTEAMEAYLHYFDKDFLGVDLEPKQRETFKAKLKIYTAQSLLNSDEFAHSGNLYLLEKQTKGYEIKTVFNIRPYDGNESISKMKKVMQ